MGGGVIAAAAAAADDDDYDDVEVVSAFHQEDTRERLRHAQQDKAHHEVLEMSSWCRARDDTNKTGSN